MSILKQTVDKPLFPEILWNRPETKHGAGKLAIIGGNEYKFAAPAVAAAAADAAGIGVYKTLLPDKLKKIIGHLENTEFAPSNRSGSFAGSSYEAMLSLATWADAVLLAGDLGRNSETAIAVEKLLETYSGSVTITQDALDMFTHNPSLVLTRENTLLVASFAQLQKCVQHSDFNSALTYSMPLLELCEQLQNLTTKYPAYIITKLNEKIIIASDGKVAHMRFRRDTWRVEQAARTSVFWLQQPATPFETLTTSLMR